MKKTLSFRAWDKEAKKFFKPAPRLNAMTISITLNGEIIGHPNIGDVTDNYELCQFTGLRDKNGTDIYEGDILKTGYGKIGMVAYHEERASFIFHDPEHFNNRLCDEMPFIEIIGNIYETPELWVCKEKIKDEN